METVWLWKGCENMEPKVFWVTRDTGEGSEVFLWLEKPSLDVDGSWWGRGKNTEPEFCWDDFTRMTRIKLKAGEIKKCRIEIITK